MYDIFISHSSLDKEDFVEPLVIQLESLGLNIWYDKNNIHKGDKLRETIINGINDSVIFIAVISSDYYKSNWACLELGILEANYPDNCLPIIFNDAKELTANKYSFLLNRNYILNDKPITEIAQELYKAVVLKKQERGLWHLEKSNLKSLIREIHSYNNFKLDQIAIYLNKVVKNLYNNVLSALNDIALILEIILSDVAKYENIYHNEGTSIVEKFLGMDFLSQNLVEHIKYLLNFRQRFISNFIAQKAIDQEEIYLIQYSVYSIIEWYAITYFKKPILKQKSLLSVAPEDFTETDIQEAFNIENLVLPPDLIASVATDLSWYIHNPLTMIGVRDEETGKLVGFFTTLPISDKLYDQIKSGCFDDTKLDTKDIRQYDIPGFYKLYLCSLCIHPAYNTTIAFKKIYTDFIDFLLNLAVEREIYISDIIADGVTPKGASLCESIGMKKITKSCHNSDIYGASLIPPSYTTLKLNNIIGKKLIRYYQNKYNEYKEIF